MEHQTGQMEHENMQNRQDEQMEHETAHMKHPISADGASDRADGA